MPASSPPPAGARTGAPTPVTAIIPLKAIAAGKTRLAAALSPADRALLLRRTFDRVAAAALEAERVSDVLVVVGDDDGAGWARVHGLAVLHEPAGGHGLNAAIAAADDHLGGRTSVVLPADLPLVVAADVDTAIAALPEGGGVVVAATTDGGTGALVRCPGDVIGPRFGPGSASTHEATARAAGVTARTVWVPGLALDLDRPEDIDLAGGWSAVTTPRTLTN